MSSLFKRKTFWAGLAAIGLLAGTFVLAHGPLPGPPCLFRLSIGIPCPGCGLTRSLMELWQGHLLASFRYHPLGLPLFVACVALLLTLLRNRPPKFAPAVQRRLLSSVGMLLVTIWAVRLLLFLNGNHFFLW